MTCKGFTLKSKGEGDDPQRPAGTMAGNYLIFLAYQS